MRTDNYFTGIAAWFSQGMNAIVLGGHHDMTVSARCHINRHRPGWRTARRIINRIFFWQQDHCKSSFRSDVMYAMAVLTHHNGGKMLSDSPTIGQSDAKK